MSRGGNASTSDGSEKTSHEVTSMEETMNDGESSKPVKKSSQSLNKPSKNRYHQDPNRFLRPTPSAGNYAKDEPPSLELHGGWIYPVARYEPIERKSSNRSNSGRMSPPSSIRYTKMRFNRQQSSNNEILNEIQPNFRPCRQSPCCCCCCCMCPCNQQTMWIPNDRQPAGNVREKFKTGPLRRKEQFNTGKRNVSLFDANQRRRPNKPSDKILTPSEMDDEIEYADRKDVNLASIWVNHAEEGFNKAVTESDKIAKDEMSKDKKG